jgi:hypothetical protein
MMKKTTLLFMLFTSLTWGQTKKIFHKSHSGKPGTISLDRTNNYGPGMAPVRYRTPESNIRLNYVISGNYNYPIVSLDTATKTMRFFDLNDSLIGCDRNFTEYLSHGYMVYDEVTKGFWVYQVYYYPKPTKQTTVNRWLKITDSLANWEEKKNLIPTSNSFIRDGNNHRILMSYPTLDHRLTSLLYPGMFEPVESFPIQVSEKVEKEKKKLAPKQKKAERKHKRINEEINQKKEEIIFSISAPKPPSNNWLIWMGISFFGFKKGS